MKKEEKANSRQHTARSEENVCEHGDHPAPAGKRFCSRACAECESTDHDARKTECAGVCLRC